MRISDWSSDVCSSDLRIDRIMPGASRPDCLGSESSARDCHTADRPCRAPAASLRPWRSNSPAMEAASDLLRLATGMSRKHHHLPCAVFGKIGRASCRERACQEVESSVGAVYIKKKNK